MDSHKLHIQAETLREEERFQEALQTYEQLILLYEKDHNYEKIAESLLGKFLTYRHLYFQTKDIVFAEIGKKSVEASLEIISRFNLSLEVKARAYFSLGECEMLFQQYPAAIHAYRKTLDLYPKKEGAIGNYRYHLGEALYHNGQKEEGKEALFQGLKEIREARKTMDEFVGRVWESGCHMRIADLLSTDEPEVAKEHLELAKRIVEGDERLVIRRRQIEALSNDFK